MPRRLLPVLAASVSVALAAPAGAQAKTWTAWLGAPGKAPASAPKGTSLNLFFPSTLRIHPGDAIKFRNNEFHTATFLAKGQKPGALFLPDPAGSKYEGLNDSAGNPFYFDGQPKFLYNATAFGPVGSKTLGDGKEHSSGAFGKGVSPKAASVTFKFPKAGGYTVICLIHPGMKQTIAVVDKKTAVPTASQVQATTARQVTKAFADVTKAAKATVPANNVYVGPGDKATVLGYFPNKLSVAAGTTVTFTERSSSEVHNMVFGPKDYLEKFFKDTDLFPTGPGTPNQVTPIDIYGTDPPGEGGVWTFDGASHGNGFFVTPLIDKNPATPLQNSSRITFTKAGTYHYFCAIHGPEMSGDITVT